LGKIDNFISGRLPIDSFIRPNKIFTADKKIILYVAGHLNENKMPPISWRHSFKVMTVTVACSCCTELVGCECSGGYSVTKFY
jgi:hypothetical protein